MSEDKKNPFGEKTIVQSSRPEPMHDETEVISKPMSQEKTMVFAQSNLKETFDARTVVRSSKPAPAPEKPAAKLPEEAPAKAQAKVLAAELPPAFKDEPAVSVSGEIALEAEEPKPDRRMSQTERRAARAALDRKSRAMMAGFAAVVVMALLCFFVGFGSNKTDKPVVKNTEEPTKLADSKDLASEEPQLTPGMKKAQQLGAYKSTTDVLSDFDRAAKKAQDHALEYTR